jgi:hypothetical protein
MSCKRKRRDNLAADARKAGLAPSTVWNRIHRDGMDRDRALSDPVMDARERGRRGAARSPWRYPG